MTAHECIPGEEKHAAAANFGVKVVLSNTSLAGGKVALASLIGKAAHKLGKKIDATKVLGTSVVTPKAERQSPHKNRNVLAPRGCTPAPWL